MRTAILVACGLIVFTPMLLPNSNPIVPEPVVPEPVVPSELALQIRAAFVGAPEGTAETYAGWFRAVGDSLDGDEALAKLKTAWVKAHKLLGIPSLLSPIVAAKLNPLDKDGATREEYKKAWVELADACEELTAEGK
tara:strand:+ start:62664 stop:63074 length:411 start_codon:yes stop_codon:yes gene_type:complete